MATLWIPDPRWEEPSLLIPGKKPIGPVTIDWSHPLARGLVEWYATGSDLVGLTGSSSSIATDKGLVEQFDGSTNDYALGAANNYPECSFFILCRGRTASNTAVGFYAGPLHKERNFIISWYAGISSFRDRVGYHDGTTWRLVHLGTDSLAAETWLGIGGTIGGGIRGFLNGAYKGTAGSAAPSTTNYVTRLGAHSTLSGRWDGDIACAYVWERKLSDAEHAEISRNPYQILCPA